MKDIIIGFLIATFLFTLPAKALDIHMDNITVRDLFAASVVCGFAASGSAPNNEYAVNYAFETADKMMKRRLK